MPRKDDLVRQDREITGVRTVVIGAGWRNYVFVLVDTDMGLTGLGEASLGGQTNAVLGGSRSLSRSSSVLIHSESSTFGSRHFATGSGGEE